MYQIDSILGTHVSDIYNIMFTSGTYVITRWVWEGLKGDE